MPWLMSAVGNTGASVASEYGSRWQVAVGNGTLIIVLLCLIPPHGILSDNEENYFALAERFVRQQLLAARHRGI